MSLYLSLLTLFIVQLTFGEICLSPYTWTASAICSTTCHGNDCDILDFGTVQSSIYITTDQIPFPQPKITRLGIYIVADHPFPTDLVVSLTHNNKTIELFENVGMSPVGVDIFIEDEGESLTNHDSLNCSCVKGPKYADQPLSTYNGMSPLNEYVLTISDVVNNDEGEFLGWCLSTLCYETIDETCVNYKDDPSYENIMCQDKCNHGFFTFNESECDLVADVPMYSVIELTNEITNGIDNAVITSMGISIEGSNFTSVGAVLTNISVGYGNQARVWDDLHIWNSANINISLADGYERLYENMTTLDLNGGVMSMQTSDFSRFANSDVINDNIVLSMFSHGSTGLLERFCVTDICYIESGWPTPAPTTPPPTTNVPQKCIGYKDFPTDMCSNICLNNCTIDDFKTTQSVIGIPTSILNIDNSQYAYITDLNVLIDANHTYTGDLEVNLWQGTFGIPLFSGVGFNGDNINVIMDDNAEPITQYDSLSCGNNRSCVYAPMKPYKMSEFNGRRVSASQFKLSITDLAYGDQGFLNKWCIESLCYADGSNLGPFPTVQPTMIPKTENCLKSSDQGYGGIMCTQTCDDGSCTISKSNPLVTSTIGEGSNLASLLPVDALISSLKLSIESTYNDASELQVNLTNNGVKDSGDLYRMITLFSNLDGNGIDITLLDKYEPLEYNDRVDTGDKRGPQRPNKFGEFENIEPNGNGFTLSIEQKFGSSGKGKLNSWCIEKLCYKYTSVVEPSGKPKKNKKLSSAEIAVLILIPVVVALIIIILYQCYSQKKQQKAVEQFNVNDNEEYDRFMDVDSRISTTDQIREQHKEPLMVND